MGANTSCSHLQQALHFRRGSGWLLVESIRPQDRKATSPSRSLNKRAPYVYRPLLGAPQQIDRSFSMNPLRLLSQEKHMVSERMKHASLLALLLLTGISAAFGDNSRLPDGTEFPVWEKPLHFTKTYYVDANAKNAA